MELKLIRQLWGIDKPWHRILERISEHGFDGVEVALSLFENSDEYPDLMARLNLTCVPMIFTEGTTVQEHIGSFRSQLEAASSLNPMVVTCHDGRDWFDESDSDRYFSEVLAIENDLGVPVAHETHRGRILYNPWTTRRLLEKFPSIRLCCDFSHWVCVCERLLADQEAIIQECADRALHIHARVGYAEGPQVPDPRVAQYSEELAAHERWWDLIWRSQKRRGFAFTTLTPEFGPPPYMQTNPANGEALSDLWEVSNWIAFRQKDRFRDIFGGPHE